MLMTFKEPKHCIKTMNRLTKINRWLNLNGIQFLKKIPFVNRYFPARGLCDITQINYLSDLNEVNAKITDSVFFIGPNHPEFYTDWMLDKEVTSILAPEVASWATHSIVNGLGKRMQSFWLKNNLIAQIPGAGSDAKEFSINYALTGKGVLLHPEGKVNWTSDYIAELYSGIIDLSHQALVRSEFKKEVYVVPVLWKLMFNADVDNKLKQEIQYISKQHKIPVNVKTDVVAQLVVLLRTLFILHMQKTDINISNYQTLSLKQLLNTLIFSLIHDVAEYFGYLQSEVGNEIS